MVVEVSMGFTSGVDPQPVSSGLGGAYLLRGSNGENIAVTKPVDEEPLALNNPKGFGGRMLGQPGIKRSIRIGETGIRELAAYLLDHNGFAGVPPSALVKISHVSFHFNSAPYKIASLQRFVDHDFDAGEVGPSRFSVASVHQIGILDVRVMNLDRHAGNILVKKQNCLDYDAGAAGAELVPIDHGLCLPEWLDDPYFEWLHWPQASVPFSESEVAYVSDLDPFKDAELLRTEIPTLRESCVRVLVLCTIFLKRSVDSGLCLAAIGKMMTREFCAGEEKPSVLENVCAQAKASIPIEGEVSTEELAIFQINTEDSEFSMISKSSKLVTSFSAVSMAAYDEPRDDYGDRNPSSMDGKPAIFDAGGEFNAHKTTGIVRSKSSLGHNNCNENWAISFGDMSDENWASFLANFERLLPEAIERVKFWSQKHRLGTSCKF